MTNVGRLDRVDLREIWKNEATGFTPWLEENIDILDEVLNLSLQVVNREESVGTFSADLLAVDGDGNSVVIECQLERSDHDHLGKTITYMSALDARTAIWICKEAHPEHQKAVNWLNETTSEEFSFYLIILGGVKIGNSQPAPLFTIVCGPSKEAKEIGKTKGHLAEREKVFKAFWESLLERSRQKTKLHSGVSSVPINWVGAGAGKTGLIYVYSISNKRAEAVLRIDTMVEESSRSIFEQLYRSKDEVEDEFKESLDWDQKEGRRVCYIGRRFETTSFQDETKWTDIQDKMITTMISLEKSLKKHIEKLVL